MSISRRGFLGSAIAASVATGLNAHDLNAQEKARENSSSPANPFGSGKRPIIISAHNGVAYLDDAFAFLTSGGDTLDAALRVVKGPEDDPNDDSVGLGGLPNEEGVVELAACWLHGPPRRLSRWRAQHQECFAGFESGHGTHWTCDAGGRRR